MKYSMRLLTVGVLPAALSGCATGLNLSSLHSQSRQTTYFDSSEMPSHSTETSYRQEATIFQLPDLSKDASLQQCLIYAALKSPALEAAFHDWRAAILRVPQVNSLPDPRLSLGYFLEEIQTRTGPMEQQLSLQQSFPWWGLLEAKGDVATAAAQKKWHDYESVRLAIFEQVALRWSSLVDLDSEIRVVEESFDLLAESERIALRSYEVDETGHDKLVRLQVELGKLEDNLQRLRDLQMPRLASLNATLARSSTGPLALPSSIELHSSSMTLEQARELLINNPSVEGLDALILQHEKATEVAILDAKPKWTVGLTYTNLGDPLDPTAPDAGDNPLMGMVGFSIPLNQDKYDAAKQEALSKRTATLAKREALIHELHSSIAEAIYLRDDSLRRIELYESALIPRAEDALTSAITSFSTGKSSAIELLDAQRTLLELQRNLQRSYVSALNSDATISKIIGGVKTQEAIK